MLHPFCTNTTLYLTLGLKRQLSVKNNRSFYNVFILLEKNDSFHSLPFNSNSFYLVSKLLGNYVEGFCHEAKQHCLLTH